MLVLNREVGEKVIIDLRPLIQAIRDGRLLITKDEDLLIEFVVVELRGNRLRLGIAAIPEIKVHREEVFRNIESERAIGAEREGRK